MRKEQLINENWLFRYHDGTETQVNIPHTWNNIDGQDGGDDYYRGTCVYEKNFTTPAFGEDERLYIEFAGVNASAKVILNGKTVITVANGMFPMTTEEVDFVIGERGTSSYTSIVGRVIINKNKFLVL